MSLLLVNSAQTQGTPGWLTGLFGVVGVSTGATIALLSTYLSDKRKDRLQAFRDSQRQQREDSQRWDTMIREVAARFLREIATNVVLVEEQRSAVARRFGTNTESRALVLNVIRFSLLHPIEYYRMLKLLRKSFGARKLRYAEVEQALNELILISPEKVVAAARELSKVHHSLMPMRLEASEEKRLRAHYKECRDKFIASVSAEMKITSKAAAEESGARF